MCITLFICHQKDSSNVRFAHVWLMEFYIKKGALTYISYLGNPSLLDFNSRSRALVGLKYRRRARGIAKAASAMLPDHTDEATEVVALKSPRLKPLRKRQTG